MIDAVFYIKYLDKIYKKKILNHLKNPKNYRKTYRVKIITQCSEIMQMCFRKSPFPND